MPTRIVIFVSDFSRAWWWLILVLFGVALGGIIKYISTPEGRRNFDAFLLKVPLIGDLARKMFLARFAESLSTLIEGGLPIAQAIEFSGEVVGNKIYQEAIFKARDGVRKGESISSILKEYPELFPPMFIQMVYVGERSGSLDKTLKNMVGFYQGEVQRTLDNLLGLLEPAMILFLGIGVAIVVASVLLPLYNISSQL